MPLVLDGDTGIVGVLLTDANGNVTFDTNTLYVDAPNNRVGIGTTSPLAPLHVNGNIVVGSGDNNQKIYMEGAVDDLNMIHRSTTENAMIMTSRHAMALIIDSNNDDSDTGTGSFSIRRNGTTIAGSASCLEVIPNGNVGIGNASTNPGNPLHINHNGAPGGIVAKIQSNGNPWFQQSGASSSWQIGVTSNGWELYNDNTTDYRVTVQNDGDVGIGTREPSAKLEVSRTSTDQTVGLTLTNLQAGGYGSGIVWKSRRSDAPNNILEAAKIVVAGENAWNSDGNTASQMQFWTQKDNTLTKHMTLNKNGNLGIGTASPAYALDVRDGIVFAGRAISDAGSISYTNTAAVFSSRGVDQDASETNVIRLMRDGTSGVQYAGVADFNMSEWESAGVNSRTQLTLNLGHGDLNSLETADVMTWRSNGYVGIGLTDPGNALTIARDPGDSRVTLLSLKVTDNDYVNGTGYNHAASIVFDMPSSEAGTRSYRTAAMITGGKDGIADWFTGSASTNFQGALRFHTRQDDVLTEQMRIDADGNVGIGTSSPGRLLTLFNNDQPVFQITNNTSGLASTNGMIFYQASGSTTHNIDNQGSGSGGDIQFMAAGSNTLKIQANGNVGIGTTSPSVSKGLHVRGGLHVEQQTSDPNNASGDDSILKVSKLDNKDWTADFVGDTSSATDYGIRVKTTTSAVYGIALIAASAYQFRVQGNGNVLNANNSYGSISDIKLKENIADATSQWNDIKAVRVRKYSFKSDQLDTPNQLGVIAQELESAGMNGLVTSTPDIDDDKNLTGTSTKEVKYSVLYMKAIKALQEAMTRIETLESEVAALKE